jgi:membrane protease YdiL (CAAX protease family)
VVSLGANVPAFREVFFEFLAWLMVAVSCALLVLTIWLWAKRRGLKLLPPQQSRQVRWTGLEIAAAFFLTRLTWPIVVSSCLFGLGFFSWLYGGDFSANQDSWDELDKARVNLWLTVILFPINLVTVFLLFRLGSGTRAYELGFTADGPRENLALASFTWLAVTPVVFGINYLAHWGYFELTGTKPESHPLQQLAEQSPSLMDAILIAVSALVIAPVWEELMFRGVVQYWLAQKDWGGHLAMSLSAVIGLGTLFSGAPDFNDFTFKVIIAKLSPFLFVIAMIPGYLFLDQVLRRWIPERKAFQAIYGAALLFGMVHSFAWPTPIPLFVLGLGLGFLAYRTQSLMGPIFVHFLFNAVACLSLVLPQMLPDWPKGSDETSASTRSVAPATCTRVPGSRQLRCR